MIEATKVSSAGHTNTRFKFCTAEIAGGVVNLCYHAYKDDDAVTAGTPDKSGCPNHRVIVDVADITGDFEPWADAEMIKPGAPLAP